MANNNTVQLNTDFAKLILHARLISKTTNSITEDIVDKKINLGNTLLTLGGCPVNCVTKLIISYKNVN